MTQTETFSKHFKEFIKPHSCHLHKQLPTFVCIDPKCQSKGMICSKCLTINGPHKNHDSVDIVQFFEHIMKAQSSTNPKQDELVDLIKRIDREFESLIKIMTDFHENLSLMIKNYISKKNELHSKKQQHLVTDSLVKKLKTCKFKTIQDMNKALTIIMGRYSIKLGSQSRPQDVLLEKTRYYLNDLFYESSFIRRELKNFEGQFKRLLTVKTLSPVVLAMEPKFTMPKLYQTQDMTYIGELKAEKPHGKGVCYYKYANKIYFGEFKNGQQDGMGQAYFPDGSYYIGEFKNDKKEGKGLEKWIGKDLNFYEGEFMVGKRNGRGNFIWTDGSWYQGNFKDGIQSGYGVLHRSGGQVEYEGYWADGKFHGRGIQFFENGERYQGCFQQDKFHGDGIFYKAESTIYGVWKNNEIFVVNMVKQKLNDK